MKGAVTANVEVLGVDYEVNKEEATIVSLNIIFVIQTTRVFCEEGNKCLNINPYPTAFPYGNGMVLHFYQQQESSTTKTVHKVINKGLKTYV